MQYAIKMAAIVIFKFHKVIAQKHNLSCGGASLQCTCTKFPQEPVSERILKFGLRLPK